MIKVYGLNNCDTCRKARKWLSVEGVEHEFHDIRKADLEGKVIAGWAGKAGWETLLNRRGTTWRGLLAQDKESVDEAGGLTGPDAESTELRPSHSGIWRCYRGAQTRTARTLTYRGPMRSQLNISERRQGKRNASQF